MSSVSFQKHIRYSRATKIYQDSKNLYRDLEPYKMQFSSLENVKGRKEFGIPLSPHNVQIYFRNNY